MNRENIIAKVYSYLSYLLRNKEANKIKRIFLFGSVARGDFDEESDIDLFVDIDKKDKASIKKVINKSLQKFDSIEGQKWKYKGINNKIIIHQGELSEWDLKSSIDKEGVLLYSTSSVEGLKKHLLFIFETIKEPKTRIKVKRKLFGRYEENFKDKGLVEKYGGKIISPRAFIVPSNVYLEIASVLSKEKVKFQFEEIWQ